MGDKYQRKKAGGSGGDNRSTVPIPKHIKQAVFFKVGERRVQKREEKEMSKGGNRPRWRTAYLARGGLELKKKKRIPFGRHDERKERVSYEKRPSAEAPAD